MSHESSKHSVLPNSAHSDYSASILIDRLCDEFEKSWKLGRPITIEQQLSKVSQGNRSALLRELLEIEIEIRVTRNEKFYADEYLDRFSQEAELVNRLFHQTVSRKKLGDYELLDEIGHGGMGIVYRCRQVFLGQTVAIKVLSQHYHRDAQVVSRFRREMRMIGGLHHPNIVQALNAGDSNGTLYLVMEYVNGHNLHTLVKKTSSSSSFPFGAAAEVIRQAAFGLQHAYEQGLVHRDIKPANLMITKNGVVKILDLGLGKFRAENQLNESLEAALTQFGATMGTVDYMAPEQWENAADVDICADIYSLGCTLFFMLTGIAPLDAHGPMSQRKKLLARLEGEMPNIEELRTDCPPELMEILRKMVAKEPVDRYQTPEELLQAITPLADFGALKSMIATVPVIFESGTESGQESRPAYRTSDEDTVHGNDWSAFSKQNQAAVEAWVFRRNWVASFWYGYKPGLLILLCALVGFFVFRGLNHPGNEPLSVDPDPNPSVIKPPDIVPPQNLDHSVLESVLCDLVQLPGLGGQWWFVEMPWYLPFVREAIPGALQQGQHEWMSESSPSYLLPNLVLAQEFLWKLVGSVSVRFPSHQKTLVEGLYQAFDKRLDKEEMVQVLRSLLFNYETAISSIPETERNASDYHTIALMQHSIAQQASDQTFAQKAKESYETAIRKYTQQTVNPISRQLQMVCLSDSARLSFWADNDFTAFEKEADRIQSLKDVRQSDLFMIEFLTAYGDYGTAAGRNNDLHFVKATEILNSSELATLHHPLRAHISERFAWSLIDQCKFKEAAEEFSKALRFRENNLESSRNPFAAIYVFHNLHGLAICKRYLGDTEEAKAQFEDVVRRVEDALAKTDFQEPAQQRYFSSLSERLSNTLERYGDCTLYGGAASFGTPYSQVSASDMQTAAERYERSQNFAINRAVWFVMNCKAAIIKSMSGATEEAKILLDELALEHPKIAFGADRSRAEMMRQVANFVYQLRWGEQVGDPEKIAAGLASLQSFLLQFNSEIFGESRYRREPLELQLFCAEVLITSKLKMGNIIAARDEVPSLETLLSQFTLLEGTRPFFYRYYNLAIQCFAESEQDLSDPSVKARAILKQLQFVRQSRFWLPGDADQETFFFHFASRDGFAIFAPTDRTKPPQRFMIPFTRSEVKEAAGSGKKLTLPIALASLILAERAEGRTPAISFNDLPCWYRKSEALHDADWPFDVPIR